MRLPLSALTLAFAINFTASANAQQPTSPGEFLSIERYSEINVVKGARTPENDAKNTEVGRYSFMRCAALFSLSAQVFSNTPDPAKREKMVTDANDKTIKFFRVAQSLKPSPTDDWMVEHIKPLRQAYSQRLASSGVEAFFKSDPVTTSDLRFCGQVANAQPK